jgi:hypothetical protein
VSSPVLQPKGATAPDAPAPSSAQAAKSQDGFAGVLHHAVHHHPHHHRTHHHAPHAVAVSADVKAAVYHAIRAEGVPAAWRSSLLFIAAQESSGHVGARNTADSARGLFKLTRASWHLNPNGAASFGNAVEEARGGIRYIQCRYDTAPKAEAFWRTHHWY